MSQKFIGYVRLVDACAAPGCPVCRCVTDDARRHLDALMYEQVTDPDTRRRLRASWGFCNWHTWMLLEIENSRLGSAIIYADLVGLFIHRVRRFADRPRLGRLLAWPFGRRRRARGRPIVELYRRRPRCPVCRMLAQTEQTYVETMLTFVDDAELQLAYVASDGICAPHAVRAIELGAGRRELGSLLGRTLPKWTRLQADLESFVGKHEYRNTKPFTEADATSYQRAFEMLSGAQGLFGNDVHAPAIESPGRRRPSPARAPSPEAPPRGVTEPGG